MDNEKFKVRVRRDTTIDNKSKVYFTCYPEDFEKCFERICRDILELQDCAVYYTPDMSAEYTEEEQEVDLARMHLFVMPVTFNLLSKESRAISVDLPFAEKNNIPILPIAMESMEGGLDKIYSKKFGTRHYFSIHDHTLDDFGYREKMKKHLESVLLDSKQIARIQAAFDAYIFLSYRKKDKLQANKLMKMIHDIPGCRDVAIWFDDFIVAGKDFKSAIIEAMKKSEFMTMLITPQILKEGNYVLEEEFPTAKRLEKDIVPVEMEETNKEKLKQMYAGIPECISIEQQEELQSRLVEVLQRVALMTNEDNIEHKFLIGLAYLDGIDVEVNRELAKKLIGEAAEQGLVEAMEEYVELLRLEESNDPIHIAEIREWLEKIVNAYEKRYEQSQEYEDGKACIKKHMELAIEYRQDHSTMDDDYQIIEQSKLGKCEEKYQEAIKLCKQLISKNKDEILWEYPKCLLELSYVRAKKAKEMEAVDAEKAKLEKREQESLMLHVVEICEMALQRNETDRALQNISSIHCQLGEFYTKQKKYEKAENHYLIGKKYAEKRLDKSNNEQNKEYLARIYNALAVIEKKKDDKCIEVCLSHYEKAFAMRRDVMKVQNDFISHVRYIDECRWIAECRMELGEYQEAKSTFEEAMPSCRKILSSFCNIRVDDFIYYMDSIDKNYFGLCDCYEKCDELDSGIQLCEEYINLKKESGFPGFGKIYERISDLYLKVSNREKAGYYIEQLAYEKASSGYFIDETYDLVRRLGDLDLAKYLQKLTRELAENLAQLMQTEVDTKNIKIIEGIVKEMEDSIQN